MTVGLQYLPKFILVKIFDCLEPVEQIRVTRVCKKFNSALEMCFEKLAKKRWSDQTKAERLTWSQHCQGLLGFSLARAGIEGRLKCIKQYKLMNSLQCFKGAEICNSTVFYERNEDFTGHMIYSYDYMEDKHQYVGKGRIVNDKLFNWDKEAVAYKVLDVKSSAELAEFVKGTSLGEFDIQCTDGQIYWRRGWDMCVYQIDLKGAIDLSNSLDSLAAQYQLNYRFNLHTCGYNKVVSKEIDCLEIYDFKTGQTNKVGKNIKINALIGMQLIDSQTLLFAENTLCIGKFNIESGVKELWQLDLALPYEKDRIEMLTAFGEIVISATVLGRIQLWMSGKPEPICTLLMNEGEKKEDSRIISIRASSNKIVALTETKMKIWKIVPQNEGAKQNCILM